MDLTLDVTEGGDHINSDKVSSHCYFALKYSYDVISNNLNFTRFV